MKTLFTRLIAGKGKTMDKEIIFAMLEDVGFTISEKESTLTEIMGTPSHLEIGYEVEL